MEFNPVIDKNKPEPVYQQIKEQLLKLIRQDNLPPGTLMPSVKLVAAASGVSLRTADQAMQALVDEGICFRRPKKGTFVSGHGLAAVKPLCGIWCTHNRNSMHQEKRNRDKQHHGYRRYQYTFYYIFQHLYILFRESSLQQKFTIR